MQDRELLELAAKAISMRGVYDEQAWEYEDKAMRWAGIIEINAEGDCVNAEARAWNPLADDGDALRLAVKLGVFDSPRFHHFRALERFGQQEKDDCYATRRAIVRAAAEIGKSM